MRSNVFCHLLCVFSRIQKFCGFFRSMGKVRKSYTAEEKLEVVAWADEIEDETGERRGAEKAAKIFGLEGRQVRRWVQEKAQLKTMKRDKRAKRGSKAHHPAMEDRLEKWVLQRRAKGEQVFFNMNCL
jgi:transposase-like protein